MKTYFVDTSIILNSAQNIYKLGQGNELIFAETVLDELDSKKIGFDEINFQAREFARILNLCELVNIKKNGIIVTELKLDDITIKIISKKHYNDYEISYRNDRKILEVIKDYINFQSPESPIFISLDSMAVFRGLSLGIPSELMTLKNDKIEYEYQKEIIFPDDFDLEDFDFANITDIYPNHKAETSSYIFKNSKCTKLAIIVNDKIEYVDESINKQIIKPINTGQKIFSAAALNQCIDLVIVDSQAGTGKSLLAISAAMALVRSGLQDKIIYIRNSIESVQKGEDVGYLPGLEDKFMIYNYPLYDSLSKIALIELKRSKENKSGKQLTISEEAIENKVKEYISKYNIQTLWPGALRGRNISGAIILDEFQNASAATGRLILSRVEKNSKVFVLGSSEQIDNPYVTKYTSALAILKNAAKEKHDINLSCIELKKVIRGPITEFAEKVF